MNAPTNIILDLPVKDYVVVSEKGDNRTARPNDVKFPFATLDAAAPHVPEYGAVKLDAGLIRVDRPYSLPRGYKMFSEAGPYKTKVVSYLEWDAGPAIPLTDNCVVGSIWVEAATFNHSAGSGVVGRQLLIGTAEGSSVSARNATCFNIQGRGNSDIYGLLAKVPGSLKLYDCNCRSWWDIFALGNADHILEAFGCHVEKLDGDSGLATNVGGISIWNPGPVLNLNHCEILTYGKVLEGRSNFCQINGGTITLTGCNCAMPNDPGMAFLNVIGNGPSTSIVLDGVTGLPDQNINLGTPPATLIRK